MLNTMPAARIGIVVRGDRTTPQPPPASTRLAPVFASLTEVGLAPEFAF